MFFIFMHVLRGTNLNDCVFQSYKKANSTKTNRFIHHIRKWTAAWISKNWISYRTATSDSMYLYSIQFAVFPIDNKSMTMGYNYNTLSSFYNKTEKGQQSKYGVTAPKLSTLGNSMTSPGLQLPGWALQTSCQHALNAWETSQRIAEHRFPLASAVICAWKCQHNHWSISRQVSCTSLNCKNLILLADLFMAMAIASTKKHWQLLPPN